MGFFSLRSTRQNKSDQELIVDYRVNDDLSSLDELFQRYIHLVFSVCQKYLKNVDDSKDAVMEIFEKSLEDLKKYEITNFKMWLYSTTINYCNYKIKKQTSPITLEKNFEKYENFCVENPEFFTLLSKRDAQFKKIETAMEQLNEAQRACIDLFYFQRKSYQQIAEITGYSVKQVKSNIQNGKKNLQKMLVKQEAIKNVEKS